MIDSSVENRMLDLVRNGDDDLFLDLIALHPGSLHKDTMFGGWLHYASRYGSQNLVLRLIDLGIDVNHQEDVELAKPIVGAAAQGRLDIIKLLIARGAELDVDTPARNPLFAAIRFGHTQVAELLVDSGIDIRSKYLLEESQEMDALRFARSWGRNDIAELLVERLGAVASVIDEFEDSMGCSVLETLFIDHVTRYIGKPERLALREIVPTDLPVAIHVIRTEDEQILVTEGMSARPMTVPAGGEAFQFAELVLRLPSDWPLTLDAFANPNNYWPIEWLKRIARYPHDNDTWLGGPYTIIANGGPPEPFARNTKLSCLMLLANPSEFGRWIRPEDGAEVVFYDVFGLYKEERDLELRDGLPELLKRFQSRFISKVLDPQRPNVAL